MLDSDPDHTYPAHMLVFTDRAALVQTRKEVRKEFPVHSFWRDKLTAMSYRVTSTHFDGLTMEPRISYMAMGTIGPSFSIPLPLFRERMERHYAELA